MIPRIDLHIHSTYSDGIKTPAEILDIVRDLGLAAFALCDHDNFGAYFEAKQLLRNGDPELIPGVELSAGRSGEDIHILGYLFDPNSETLIDALEHFRKVRNQRGELMLEKLKNLGVDISLDLVKEIAGQSAIGRPHIADAMVRMKVIRGFDEAFERYIGLNGPAYIPKANLTPREAIELIHKANGLAILAHPSIADAAKHIEEFIGYGLDGIEVYHPYHTDNQRKRFSKLVSSRTILGSGGSDYHGRDGRYGMIGSMPVPPEYLTAMKTIHNSKNRGPS